MKRAFGMGNWARESSPFNNICTQMPFSLTQRRLLPLEVVMVAHGKSNLGQACKQHDFFVLIHMSNQSSSNFTHMKLECWPKPNVMAALPNIGGALCGDGDFSATILRPVFPASHVQHVSDLHSKFALWPHYVWKYGRHPICDRWD